MSIQKKALLALLIGLALPGAQRLAAYATADDIKKEAQAWCPMHYASAGAPSDGRRLCALWGYRR